MRQRLLPCFALMLLLFSVVHLTAAPAPPTPAAAPVTTTPAPSAPVPPPAAATSSAETHGGEKHSIIWKDGEGKPLGQSDNPEDRNRVFPSNGEQSAEKPPSNTFGTILSMLFSLALVLGCAYLILLGIKKYKQGGLPSMLSGIAGASSSRVMTLVESLTLGPGRSLLIVKVGERYFLLAQTAQQISVLHEFADDDALAEYLTQPPAPQAPPAFEAGFMQLLTRLLPQRNAAPAEPAEPQQTEQSDDGEIPLARFVATRQRKEKRP